MTKQIELKTCSLLYDLERKNVKNINVRVRKNGTIVVSANPFVPLSRIESFLRENEGFLLRALQRAEKQKEIPCLGEDGEKIKLFDEERTIYFLEGTGKTGDDGEHLIFYVRNPQDEQLRKKAVEKFRKKHLEQRMLWTCRQAQEDFERVAAIPTPIIRFRNMQSRWGSCQPTTGKLVFNYRLIDFPYACAEYVVYHEFAHFLQANHSPAFYREIERFIPDWKIRRKILRGK